MVDREQTRRDARSMLESLADDPRLIHLEDAEEVVAMLRALLAELEQAERERAEAKELIEEWADMAEDSNARLAKVDSVLVAALKRAKWSQNLLSSRTEVTLPTEDYNAICDALTVLEQE